MSIKTEEAKIVDAFEKKIDDQWLYHEGHISIKTVAKEEFKKALATYKASVISECVEKMKMEGEMAKLTPFQQTVNTYIENRGKEILSTLQAINSLK